MNYDRETTRTNNNKEIPHRCLLLKFMTIAQSSWVLVQTRVTTQPGLDLIPPQESNIQLCIKLLSL